MNDACRCGAPLVLGARFCVRCGAAAAPTPSRRQQLRQRRAEQRRLWAVPWLFVAPITAVAFEPVDDGPWITAAEAWWHAGLLLACGLGAGVLLGRRALWAGLQRWPSLHTLLLALPAAALAFLAGTGWVELLGLWFGAGARLLPPSSAEWVLTLAVAPLAEEWLCRGLTWTALRPFTPPRTRIVATAVLFACLHGLNGGYLLELPHRFVAGLLFGWLRQRSDSLWPCVLAHFLTNLGAMLVS